MPATLKRTETYEITLEDLLVEIKNGLKAGTMTCSASFDITEKTITYCQRVDFSNAAANFVREQVEKKPKESARTVISVRPGVRKNYFESNRPYYEVTVAYWERGL